MSTYSKNINGSFWFNKDTEGSDNLRDIDLLLLKIENNNQTNQVVIYDQTNEVISYDQKINGFNTFDCIYQK